MQSEKSKRAGNVPSTSLVIDFLKASYQGPLDIVLLKEDMNFNSRAASLLVSAIQQINICTSFSIKEPLHKASKIGYTHTPLLWKPIGLYASNRLTSNQPLPRPQNLKFSNTWWYLNSEPVNLWEPCWFEWFGGFNLEWRPPQKTLCCSLEFCHCMKATSSSTFLKAVSSNHCADAFCSIITRLK